MKKIYHRLNEKSKADLTPCLVYAGVFMQGYGFGMETTHISETDKSGIIFKFQTTDDSLYLPADSSGLIAKINFKVLKDAPTTVKILETTFDDTYPNWTKKHGVFTVSTI